MSYFDQASLVMIPSGYKTSKVYSVKPTDGSGDLAFTRSNDTATRVNSAGLIEKVRTNQVLQSQTFDNASWVKYNSSVTANSTTAPDGTSTADTLVDNTANDIHVTYQSIALSAGEHTISCYAKANTLSHLSIYIFDGTNFFSSGIFNLSNGTVSGAGSIVSAGNGWYRVSFTTTIGSGSGNVYIALSNGSTISYVGSGQSIYIWGYQVETGVATPYIATTSAAVSVGPVANVPRLDYLNSSCPRLLLEPQRTNINLYSEDLTNAFYFKNNCTIAANSVISPDGFQNADTATFTSGGNFGYFFSFAGNSSVAFSFFVKKGNYTSLNVLEQFYFATSITFNLDAKTATAGGKVEDYGNGWLRCSWVQAYGAGQTAIAWQFSEAAGAAGFAYFYGFQVEAGAYATSYIPTLGAAVTRGDELATKTSASALIGQTEGTLFLEFDFVVGEQANYGLIYNAGFSTYIYMNQQVSGSIFGQVQPFDISFSVAKPNGRYKCALAYKSGSSAFFVNGVQVGTTNTTTFSPSAMDIFSFLNGDNTKGIRQALLFKTRLSNADLAALTA